MNSFENLKQELDWQKEEIERQRKELMDSIMYASYIQSALLPEASTFKKLLPESFVLYLPRDVVSGDFYWISKFRNHVILAVADCTGHGVPGAFMSVLGISFLNEIVARRCHPDPGCILNQLREMVMKSLNQTGDIAEQKDGMDVALCVIDKSTNTLHFSGANNNLYLVRNKKLMVYRGDRMPIGISATTEVSFSSHEISLEENDAIYIFTDGFPDQFGGNNNKKFKYQRTRKLLSELNGITMSEQKEKIYRIFESWKGNSPQVDDILFIGFKVIDNDLNVSL